MNGMEAEKIINQYGGAIAQNPGVFKKVSSLPCSKARIREAFYVYIPALIDKLGHLPKKMGEELVACYCMLDAFIADSDVDRLNDLESNLKSGSSEYTFYMTKALRNGEYFDEINEYIGEYFKERGVSDEKTGEEFYTVSWK